jgi:endonuclease YncB( thermonuclease family)
VHLPGGKLFAEEMIQEWYGLRYIYKNKPTIYDTQLQRAEVLAQNNNRGIWNICQGIRKRVNSIF